MSFQAVIGAQTLKSFTKSLTCLSRYSDDVIIQAAPDFLFLSATNSSKSAFCRIKLTSQYFEKLKVNLTPPGLTFQTPPDADELQRITGQLLVKSLLSILKHKTVEKTVDRCVLSISDNSQEPSTPEEDETDSLESKLIVKLHCKHGVVKTHKLLLLTPTGPYAPQISASPIESRVTVGPHALKDILAHFPHAKGTKSDPELIWLFGLNDVKVKSKELGGEAKGKSISTEIKMSADEFDSYNIHEPPVSVGLHLREFNATVTLAESLSVALDLRFTEPRAPIYIEFNTDSSDSEFLFLISTTPSVYDSTKSSDAPAAINLRKRTHEENQEEAYSADGSRKHTTRAVKKKPLSAATETRATPEPATTTQIPPKPLASKQTEIHGSPSVVNDTSLFDAPEQLNSREPLFLPGASQLSNVDLDILRSSGLGIEHMDYAEFEAMMEEEGEEVGMSTRVGLRDGLDTEKPKANTSDRETGMDVDQMAPSQAPTDRRGEKEFRPLFDD